MNSEHSPVPVSPLQLKLKDFCIWIETKFEHRIGKGVFTFRMAAAFVGFAAIFYTQKTWMANVHWPLWTVSWLLLVWIAFWVILQMVRRLHDLGKSGNLFWGIVVPFGVAWRINEVFHLAEKGAERWGVWIVLAALCGWSIGLTLQLFLKKSAEGPNRFER